MLTVIRNRSEAKAISETLLRNLSDDSLERLRDSLAIREKSALKAHLETCQPIADFDDDADRDTPERRAWAELSRQLRAVQNEIGIRAHREIESAWLEQNCGVGL